MSDAFLSGKCLFKTGNLYLSFSGLSQGCPRSLYAILSYFVRQTKPKILRLVILSYTVLCANFLDNSIILSNVLHCSLNCDRDLEIKCILSRGGIAHKALKAILKADAKKSVSCLETSKYPQNENCTTDLR